MLRKFLIALLLSLASAQAQTLVTATVVDPNGNPFANGTAAAQSVANSGQPAIYSTPVATNASGLFSITLTANTYIFTICAPPTPLGPTQNLTPAQVCFTSQPISIGGASQNISTALNAVAVVLGPKSSVSNVNLPNPATFLGAVSSPYQINGGFSNCEGCTSLYLTPNPAGIATNDTGTGNFDQWEEVNGVLLWAPTAAGGPIQQPYMTQPTNPNVPLVQGLVPCNVSGTNIFGAPCYFPNNATFSYSPTTPIFSPKPLNCYDLLAMGASTSTDLTPFITEAINAAGNNSESVCIDGTSLTLQGPATYYTVTPPFTAANAGSTQIRFFTGCGLQIITSVTWATPTTAPEFRSCMISGNSAYQAGTTLEPCAATAGCGSGGFAPQFSVPDYATVFPVAGSAVAVAGPWQESACGSPPCIYSTGTITMTNLSATVTGSGTTFTQAMVGGYIWETGASKSCVGYVLTVNSATSITLAAALPASSACGVVSGGAYNLVEANELPLLWSGGGAMGSGVNVNSFGAQLEGWRLDCENMPHCLAFYTQNNQERTTLINTIAVGNAGYQSTNNFSGNGADGGIVCDNSYVSGAQSGCDHFQALGVEANCNKSTTTGTMYGEVFELYNQVLGQSQGGPDFYVSSTIAGNSSSKCNANVWIDGAEAGTLVFPHLEYWANEGIEVGPNYLTSVQILEVNGANGSTATPLVKLDTYSYGTIIQHATYGVSGVYVYEDVSNPCGEAAPPCELASSANLPAVSYYQPGLVTNQTSTFQTLAVQTAVTSVTSAVTAATFAALPANIQNLKGKTVRIKWSGVFSTTTSNDATVTIALTYGGITPCTITSAATSSTAVTNAPVGGWFEMTTSTTGSSGTMEAHCGFDIDTGGATSPPTITPYRDTNHASVGTLNLTASNTPLITVAASGSGIPSFQVRQASLEISGN